MQKTKFDIPTNKMGADTNNISIEVTYQKGGINYFSYNTERRGVYVLVRPEKIADRGGYVSRSFDLFGNMTFKICVKELARKSQKAIDTIAAAVEPHVQELAQHIELGDKEGFRRLLNKITLSY